MKKQLLAKLKNGNTVYGTCISSVAPLWGKAARNAGLDFVFLDTEHIPLERMEIAALCQLYSAQGIAPIVRIPSPDPYRACQIIDAGAEGILAPYIEETEQVTEMVGALKYRPLKGRRLQEALKNPSSLEPELKNYLANYNLGNICLINIESVPAFEKLDELLSVPGVDAVFIGPHDLSVSLGVPEMYDHPKFEKVVQFIIHKCREKNVAVGIHFSESPDRQIKWMKEGANIIIHSSDIAIFSQQLLRDINYIKKNKGDNLLTSSEVIIV
jgi:2-keto-3-deoxy-L-rhamnonate aldolase RhmA